MRQVLSFSNYLQIINEAQFSGDKLERAVKLIKRVLEKQLHKTLYQFGVVDEFSVEGKRKYGLRYFVGDDAKKQFRINWLRGNTSDQIDSVDIWDVNAKWDKPTIHVDLKDKNIVQVLGAIVELIKDPKVGPVKLKESLKMHLVDPIEETAAELPDTGYIDLAPDGSGEYTLTVNGKVATKSVYKQGLPNRWRHMKTKDPALKGLIDRTTDNSISLAKWGVVVIGEHGKPEVSHIGDIAQKRLDATPTADPDIVFKDLEDLTTLVTGKFRNSLVVTGMAGVGKTYVIEQVIKESGLVENEDWFSISGSVTAYGMYARFVKSPNKLILFDDCDSVFKDADARNILKAALDTKAIRRISWINANTYDPDGVDEDEKLDLAKKGKLPNYVDFSGQVIFISNLPQSKMEPALLSRSFTIDITLSAKDIFKRIETLLDHIEPDVEHAMKLEVLEFLKKEGSGNNKQINMRTFLGALGIRKSGVARWQDLVHRYA